MHSYSLVVQRISHINMYFNDDSFQLLPMIIITLTQNERKIEKKNIIDLPPVHILIILRKNRFGDQQLITLYSYNCAR